MSSGWVGLGGTRSRLVFASKSWAYWIGGPDRATLRGPDYAYRETGAVDRGKWGRSRSGQQGRLARCLAVNQARRAGSENRRLCRKYRRPFPDVLSRKQGEDTVLKSGALLNQVLPLTVWPLGVLLLRCRHPYHAADLVVAADIGSQQAEQTLGIKPDGLGSACPAVHEKACGLNNIGRIPVAVSNRCNQKPSRPASKQQASSGARPASLTGRSSINRGTSCPSAAETGHLGPDQGVLVSAARRRTTPALMPFESSTERPVGPCVTVREQPFTVFRRIGRLSLLACSGMSIFTRPARTVSVDSRRWTLRIYALTIIFASSTASSKGRHTPPCLPRSTGSGFQVLEYSATNLDELGVNQDGDATSLGCDGSLGIAAVRILRLSQQTGRPRRVSDRRSAVDSIDFEGRDFHAVSLPSHADAVAGLAGPARKSVGR